MIPVPGYAHATLARAEELVASGSIEEVYGVLRELPLADFCALHTRVAGKFPELSRLLPVNPSAEVQEKWVGDSGPRLMVRSCSIMRLFEAMYIRSAGRDLRGAYILDYGSGWGRLLRLANYFSPIDRVRGVDVMQSSLEECARSRVPNKVELIEAMPGDLPYEGVEFDLIFSWSVFTHIPERVAQAALAAARTRVAGNGVYIVTIRSYEFWNMRQGRWDDDVVQRLRDDHQRDGYAFQTFANPDYGDTTMSFDFLAGMAKDSGWRIDQVDRDLSEPYQIAVALTPV